jgi:hypothetical protein
LVTTVLLATPDFSAATLGEPRLNERMRLVTADLLTHPGCSLPQACRSRAALKGAYRFFDHPDTAADNLLPAFVRPAVRSLARRREVLAVHDSTSFNYSSLLHATGLGFLNDSRTARGIHLHSSLLLDDRCNLVGIADLQFWVRPDFRQETDDEVRNLPIEAKESYKWLVGMRATHDAFVAPSAKAPRLIHVMDREGDIHEVFAEVRALGDQAVIRCAQNRRVEADQPDGIDYAKQRVARRESMGTMTLRVPRKDGGYRTAEVEVRAEEVRLRPNEQKRKGRKPLKLGLIEVREISTPPAGEEQARWWLWTTLGVTKLKLVQRVLKIYRARWRVEDYHRAMKTGCGAEKLRLQEGESLMKALTLLAWVATRVVRLRDEAKANPEQDCAAYFAEEEWRLLWARQHGRPWRKEDGQPNLGEVIQWLGRLGGHLGRKNDPLPGAECLSKSLYALDLLLQGRALGKAEAQAEQDQTGQNKKDKAETPTSSPPSSSSHQPIHIPRG